MGIVNIVAVVCCILLAVKEAGAKEGFILTSPKVIDAGSTEYFTLTVFDVPSGEAVTLTLLDGYRGDVMAKGGVNVVNNYNVWIEMAVPSVPADMDAKLRVEGLFSNGYRIYAEKKVRIRHNSVVTFIETDKPLYKPGQTVRFRVLPMDSQLKPLGNDTEGDVWIEDPSNIRVAQWKKIKFLSGMMQMELPLSEEPTLGTWSIKGIIKAVPVEQKFRVEKYVLPKFEVTVKPPEYVMANAETITTEICASYTYGKKVDGIVKAKLTYEKQSWERDKPIPSVEYIGQISGCYEFVVNAHDILLSSSEFGYRTMKIIAEVTENGTEIVRNASAKVEITHSPLLLNFLGSQNGAGYFKPGIPFNGKLKVEKPDSTPAPSEKIEICTEFSSLNHNKREICHIFTSNKNGIVQFSVAPATPSVAKIKFQATAVNYHSEKYTFEIWREKIEKPKAFMELSPWYSPSGCYLQIEPISEELECEKLKRVKIRYSAEKGAAIKFFHQVLSRGRIVQQGSHQRTFYTPEEERQYDFDLSSMWSLFNTEINNTSKPESGEFSLSFDPRATMAPIARLLVFYVRDDGEVVADSKMFRIEKCLMNKVGLHFRHEQQYPSTEAALLLSATPFSVCGIGMIDKSIRFLNQGSQFNKKKLFELMETYDVGKNDKPHQVADDYCINKDIPKEDSDSSIEPLISAPSFPSVDRRPYMRGFGSFSRSISKHVDSMMAFEEAGMVIISDLKIETRPCLRDTPVAFPLEDRLIFDSRVDAFPINLRAKTFEIAAITIPEVPLPAAPMPKPQVKTPPKSTEEIRSYFPETWLWEMQVVGLSGEMALNRQLPHTITEWTGGAICVHPKTGLGISEPSSITAFQPFFLSFQLPYSVVRGEIIPLVVSVFNYLTECLPIKLSLEPSEDYKILSESRSQKICVCGGESESTRFMLRPIKIGLLNITIYGYSVEEDDEVCGNEITARLSARDAATKQLLVEAEGFPKEESLNYYVCPENTNGSYASEIDLLLPEDVVDGSARAYMSVSGDLMGPALNGLRSLVKLPVGCGEQNMILFVPNIFVLDYLASIGKITEEIKADCLSNMQKGYQRELKYRHGDGSYSAFGKEDAVGSLWLTSFVLKSFGQARRFIDIDEHDLRLSTAWILEKQFENGCFEPTGYVHQKNMKGGLNEGEKSLAPLSAYVLIALLESGAVRPDHSSIKNALKCIESDNFPSSYGLSLFAYATTLAGEMTLAQSYLNQLEEKAVKRNNQMYWEANKSKSVGVEIAGYYILAQLAKSKAHPSSDNIALVQPVMRWITKQRNSNGGFVSTQDTVIALQALATLAANQFEKPIDLGLVVEGEEFVRGFKVDESNKLVTQSVKIPVLPTGIDLQAVGLGCALVQFSLRYNVEKVSGSEAFDLNIDVLRQGSSNCNLPKIGICMRYKPVDQTSNMVVLSVKMASGFLPEQWSLQKLLTDMIVQLKRHEVDGNQVNLYFNELNNEQKCFHFFIKSEIEVEEMQPSSIILYDYYDPELKIAKEYIIPNACSVLELPDLPWLPPLIDTENEDFDAILVDAVTEVPASEIPFNQTDDENNFPEYDSPSGNITFSTSNESLFDDNLFAAELSDDADVFIVGRTSSNLDNFIDVTNDLDFPDGIEGNIPVTVLPDEETTQFIIEDCPICEDDLPENFTDIYCSSAFALRVTVRDIESKTAKILQDISFFVPHMKAVRKFAKLVYNSSCFCPQLQNGNTVLVIGAPITLWNNEKDKHELQLDSNVHIISSSKALQIRKARNQCNNDP